MYKGIKYTFVCIVILEKEPKSNNWGSLSSPQYEASDCITEWIIACTVYVYAQRPTYPSYSIRLANKYKPVYGAVSVFGNLVTTVDKILEPLVHL